MKETNEKKSKTIRLLKIYWKSKIIPVLIGVVLATCVWFFAFGTQFFTKSDTTKLGFENIGELATQSAHCTEVNVTDDVRTLFGIDIPFTQSKYIYSYDVIIKAGFQFNDITPTIQNDTITLNMPAPQILSTEIIEDSLKVYLEKESIFNQISLEENNTARIELINNAQQSAIENGLLEDAKTNAETLLRSFLAKQYDLEKYTVNFVYEE